MNYRNMILLAPLALLFSTPVKAMVEEKVMVEEMANISHLKDTIKEHENVVIKIYAHWCGHCNRAEKPFKELAIEHKDNVKSVSINADNDALKPILEQLGVEGLPTFLFFKKESKPGYVETSITKLSSKPLFIKKLVGFSHEDLRTHMKEFGAKVKKHVAPELKHKRGEEAFSFKEVKTIKALKPIFEHAFKHDKYVALEVGTTWCGACKKAAPEFKELMNKYKDKIEGAQIDADISEFSPMLGKKFNIHAYPSFVLIRKTPAKDYEAVELPNVYASTVYFKMYEGFTFAFKHDLAVAAEVPGAANVVVKSVVEKHEPKTVKKHSIKKTVAKKHMKKPVQKHIEETTEEGCFEN